MRVSSSAALTALVIVVSAVPAVGQPGQAAPSAKGAVKKTWTQPRTPEGQPDMQGVWTNNTVTPLERPKDLAGKEFYTDAELAAGMKKEHERLDLNVEEGLPTEPGTAADVHTISASTAWTGPRLSSQGTTGLPSLWGRRASFLGLPRRLPSVGRNTEPRPKNINSTAQRTCR